MKRGAQIVTIVLFIGILLLPNLAFPLCKQYIDHENHQNRELSEFPEFDLTNLNELPGKLENYYTDHLPFKNQLMKLNMLIDVSLFNSVGSNDVLLGKEHWLFYKAGKNIQDYRGVEEITVDELEYIKMNVIAAKEYFQARGSRFVILICPNKEEIYDEYLPDYVRVENEDSRADIIKEYLTANTDLTVLYPREVLREAKSAQQIYRKYDTHWNDVGAFVASQECLRVLGKETVAIDAVSIAGQGTISGDLANMLAMKSVFDDDIDYKVNNYKDWIEIIKTKDIEQQYLNFQEYKSSVKGNESVLVLGDSFAEAMMPFLAKNYKKVSCVHVNNYEKGLIDSVNPDVVICELVERSVTALGGVFDNIMRIENE